VNDQSQSELEDRDALFYPYIHFRDVEWLKRTLLVFPHIVRMVPEQYVPQDNPFVQQLAYAETRRGPLVRRAELFTPDVILAQRQLKAKLQRDLEHHGDDFIRRFGRATTDAEKPPGDRGFQMHRAKTMPELIPFLEESGLAWEPTHPDDYNYCELHPRIGQAVLSTIAIACAQDEGLDVVTDPADQESRMLDDHLATEGKDRIYEAWVHHASDGTKRAKKPDGSAILKVLVYQHADQIGRASCRERV